MSANRSDPLRVAVVGAGMMGQHHLRIYNMLKNCRLTAVVDSDPARAKAAADQYGCEAYASPDEIVGKVDAASVVVPSSLHHSTGSFLLDNGIHCLIEKPLALTIQECESLIAAAERGGASLAVGHVERFNPAVETVGRILAAAERIDVIEARRLSGASKRITDVNVVRDLMIHDIEVLLSLVQHPIVSVQAQASDQHDGAGADYANALLRFANGTMASLTASRITQNKVRDLQVTCSLGTMCVDYINQEVLLYRQGDIFPSASLGPGNYVLDLAVERILVRKVEPLVSEINHFVDSVIRGAAQRVTGSMALEALRTVEWIEAAMERAA